MEAPKNEKEYKEWIKKTRVRRNGQDIKIKREINETEKEAAAKSKEASKDFDYDKWIKDNDIKPSLED